MLNIMKLPRIFSKNKLIKCIMVLAIPAIIENILQVFIGVVDTYFIGKIGTDAIAAVGLTNLTMNVYISFFLALGVGATAVVSRNIGAGNIVDANKAVKQSIMIGLFIGLFIGALNLVFAKNILHILGAKDDEVLQYALPYFMTVAVPSVFLCIMMILSSALRGAGDTKTPMKVALIANIINAILDYIAISSGFGIIGLGLATTFSRTIGVVLLVRKLIKEDNKFELLGKWRIERNMMKSITKISLPAAVERLFMRSGQLIYGSLIIKIGVSTYAAHNIAGTIESFSYLPGMGFGVAAATLVGQNLGAKKEDTAQKYGFLSYLLATGLMVVVGIIFFIFAPFLAGLFTTDTFVIREVVKVLRLISLFQPFLCVTLVLSSALQGAGDTKFPMYLTLIGIWGIRILGVYILGIQLQMGLMGVWLAYTLDITIRGCILMLRYINGKWKTISIE